MTTKELENKLKISTNTCIHCPTLELAKQVLSIFHQLGLKWCRDNTVYYPFDGEYSSLGFAHRIGGKIISAEEFILLHTKFDLENYIPKGELIGFPKEIIACMLECQEEQWNKIDVSVFEKDRTAGETTKGFVWWDEKEGYDFWNEVIRYKNFALFFEKYPKKQEYQELKNNKKEEDSQEFRVEDNVIDIILDLKGKITNVKSNGNLEIQFEGKSSITEYNLKIEKRPSLLHYRDDFDYDVIDFNNLPKRQNSKRWRANRHSGYWIIDNFFEVYEFEENNTDTDDTYNNLGNYFQTKEEAQEVADKLNKHFQELINPNK